MSPYDMDNKEKNDDDEEYYRWYLEGDRKLFAWVLMQHGGIPAEEAERKAIERYPYEPPQDESRWLVHHDIAWVWAMRALYGHEYYLSRPELQNPSNAYRKGRERLFGKDPTQKTALAETTAENLYQKRHEAVAMVEALGRYEAVHKHLGEPVQLLPITDFFVTDPNTLAVTYCDLVELYHFHGCAIRIGYINHVIKKVRGMPLEHWRPPEDPKG